MLDDDNITNESITLRIYVYVCIYIYNDICHIVDFRCCCRCVVVVQVGECVINDLGTVVVVVVVVAVVVVAVSHHAFQSIHTCIIMHPMCSCIRYS